MFNATNKSEQKENRAILALGVCIVVAVDKLQESRLMTTGCVKINTVRTKQQTKRFYGLMALCKNEIRLRQEIHKHFEMSTTDKC